MSEQYPILESDIASKAVIEPSQQIDPRDVPEHCVICFFRKVLEKVVAEHGARIVAHNYWEDGRHDVYELEYAGQRLAFFHPGVGAPLVAGLLEEVIAFGCRKFIACGGAGVLHKEIAVGHLLVVAAAVRDEGVSYHYLPPGREVMANLCAVAALETALQRRGVPYQVGKTWTTDAPYRETRAMVERRKAEGCLMVEMEAAALLAVAQYRNVLLGQVLYGGDDVSGDAWDNRGWQSRQEIRENLFWLAAEACVAL